VRVVSFRSTIDRPHPHFAGWTMLTVSAFALLLSTPAQTYGFSVFVDPMLADLGISRSFLSIAYGVATLASAGMVLLIGHVIDRRGHRVVMAISAAIYAVALLLMGSVTGAASLLIGFALLRTAGASVLSLSARTLVSQWFERRRGRAVSLINVGKTLGMAFVPSANALLIAQIGWRDAWRVNALVILLLVPVAILIVRGRPEEIGQFPDGERIEPPADIELQSIEDERQSWTVGQALRTRTMWLLLSATIVPAAITNGLSFNQISILTQAGLTPTIAALTFAVESAIALPMTLFSGWLSDRIGPRFVLMFGQVALLLTLVCLAFTASLEMAILFGVLRGITTGTWVLGTEVILPVYFGRRYLGSIVGLSFAAAFTGAAIGPLPFGVSYDLTGGYDVAIVGLAVLPVITTLAAFLAKPPARRRPPHPADAAAR